MRNSTKAIIDSILNGISPKVYHVTFTSASSSMPNMTVLAEMDFKDLGKIFLIFFFLKKKRELLCLNKLDIQKSTCPPFLAHQSRRLGRTYSIGRLRRRPSTISNHWANCRTYRTCRRAFSVVLIRVSEQKLSGMWRKSHRSSQPGAGQFYYGH